MNSLEMAVSEKPFFKIVEIIREPLRRKYLHAPFKDIDNNVLFPASLRMYTLEEGIRLRSKKLVNRYDKR